MPMMDIGQSNSDLLHLLLWQSQAALYEVACFLCPETNRKLRYFSHFYIIYNTLRHLRQNLRQTVQHL